MRSLPKPPDPYGQPIGKGFLPEIFCIDWNFTRFIFIFFLLRDFLLEIYIYLYQPGSKISGAEPEFFILNSALFLYKDNPLFFKSLIKFS